MMNEKRCKVINELIATERDYLENLHVVKECFIYPMKQNNMLIEDEMEIIFINWNDLVLCTNRLYKSLKIRRKMTTKKDINIGDVLCENVSIYLPSTYRVQGGRYGLGQFKIAIVASFLVSGIFPPTFLWWKNMYI